MSIQSIFSPHLANSLDNIVTFNVPMIFMPAPVQHKEPKQPGGAHKKSAKESENDSIFFVHKDHFKGKI